MIDRLVLGNFKGFQQAELPLGPLTLLTGLNSSGKSTVLQSLALLRQSYEAGDLHATQPPRDDQGARRPFDTADQGFLLNGNLIRLGTGEDVLHEDFTGDEPRITLGVDEGLNRYSWTVGYESEQNQLPLLDVDLPYTSEGPEGLPAGAAALIPAFFVSPFQYLHADRISPAEPYPRDHHTAVTRGFLGVRGEHTVNFLRLRARDEVPEGPLRHPRADSGLLIDQVAAWMGDLCPGVDIQADAIEGADTVRLSYGFEGSLGPTRRRRPSNVGFGLTYVLPIVVASLTARPGSLILLENPEAHLHPQGQTRMAGLAAAAAAYGAQLVVETHSDHVINGVRLAVKQGRLTPEQVVLHYFRGDGTGVDVVSPKVDRDGLLDQWPEGFFDELENTLDQLIG
ncbi:AAA family ATPase [Streptomyces erythrochromogenes]|uniref:AAA family ATPase n=1 Tax=Streptomyces erythrochromogenes TaxID=285574 RepID=UPI00368A6B5B